MAFIFFFLLMIVGICVALARSNNPSMYRYNTRRSRRGIYRR